NVRLSPCKPSPCAAGRSHQRSEQSSSRVQGRESELPTIREQSSSCSQTNLYEVLSVESTACQQEIRKAYHKLALQLHPDKNLGDKEGNEKFQQLQKAMSILARAQLVMRRK
ncbi:hypothetical protein SOVF_082490, partial [Spinacia oleracea]